MLSRTLAAVAAPLILATLLASPATAREPNGCATPVAHRGVTQGAAQNTLKAFRRAAADHVGFETDLRTTSDGYVVLMHNSRVNATTNGSGRIASMTLRQVRRLRTVDGQQVPELREALKLVRDTAATHITMDLKSLTDRSFERVVSLVKHFGIQDKTRSIAFGRMADRLVQLHAEAPGVRVARIWPRGKAAPTPAQIAPYGGVQLAYSQMSGPWVAQMNAAGLDVGLRVSDDPAVWQAGKDWGVDRILTDHVSDYQAWCGA